LTSSFNKLLAALKNLRSESGEVKAVTDQFKQLLQMAKDIDFQPSLKKAEKISADSEVMLGASNLIQKGAEDTLKLAEEAVQVFAQKQGPLSNLMDALRASMTDLEKTLGSDGDLLTKADNHADDLKKLAKELKDTFQQTEKFAAKSMEASERYSEIADAIEEAHRAASDAKNTAAQSKEQATNAGTRVGQMKTQSEQIATFVGMEHRCHF